MPNQYNLPSSDTYCVHVTTTHCNKIHNANFVSDLYSLVANNSHGIYKCYMCCEPANNIAVKSHNNNGFYVLANACSSCQLPKDSYAFGES